MKNWKPFLVEEIVGIFKIGHVSADNGCLYSQEAKIADRSQCSRRYLVVNKTEMDEIISLGIVCPAGISEAVQSSKLYSMMETSCS